MKIYCSGVFDLCHVGHMKFFESIVNRFENCTLVVGVHSDKETESYKRKPILNESIRYETIKYCKYVDSVLEDAPLQISAEFIFEHDIDIVAISEEYINHEKNMFFHKGAYELNRFVYIPRTNYISTSDIMLICNQRR